MKRIIAISLITCFLVSTTELCQLLKLPKLIEHFAQHREQNSDLSFQAFLNLHYLIDHGKDADYQEDMQLPFKTFQTPINSNYTGFIAHHIYYTPMQSFAIVKTPPLLINDEISDFIVYNSVWRPPSLS